MKFGENFEERESVPRWRRSNVDYNSLKKKIKLQTTKNQATAIPIPGQVDTKLAKFETSFLEDIRLQHDRVGQFVKLTVEHIKIRLHQVSADLEDLHQCRDSDEFQQDLDECQILADNCDDDIRDLKKFIHANTEALRKIMKKYRKWTRSTNLASRFREHILSSPDTFTRRNLQPLKIEHQKVQKAIDDAKAVWCSSSSSTLVNYGSADQSTEAEATDGTARSKRKSKSARRKRRLAALATGSGRSSVPIKRYWNEYDDGEWDGGSNAGGGRGGGDEYLIEINPDEPHVMDTIGAVCGKILSPLAVFGRMVSPFPHDSEAERRPLLPNSPVSPTTDYMGAFQSSPTRENADDDASSGEMDLEAQRFVQYHEGKLHRNLIASFVLGAALLVLAVVLIVTLHWPHLSAEAVAGVFLCFGLSLGCSCLALLYYGHRQDKLTRTYRVAVIAVTLALWLGNGAILLFISAEWAR